MLVSVVLLSLTVNAFAVSWDNGSGDNLWSTATNWSPDGLPTISNPVNIALASGPIINAPTAAAGTEIRVGMSGGTAPLTMNGGTLSSGNWLMIGIDTSGKAGTFTMTGGTISLGVTSSVDGHLWLGYKSTGTFTMNGGTVNVPGKFGLSFSGGTANAYLNGGTITTHDFSMTSSSRIDITNGKLIMDGNQTATVNGYISSGWITGYGLASNVRYDYNITTLNKTTVWAVGSNKAANPSPANGASNVAKTTTLSWTAGPGAASHDVYFGTSNPPAFQNNQTATTFDPGVLDFNTTYYWCIDEVNGPNTVTGDLWMFTTASGLAKNPDPANGATNVAFDKVLYWAAGPDAASHDVYFGTILNDVNSTERLLGDINGDGIVDFNDVSLLTQYWLANPAGSEPYAGVNDDDIVDFIDYALLSQDWMNTAGPVFKGNQDTNSFNPGTLANSTTYYWRIDEVNGPNTVTGDVWSFTTQSGKAFSPSPASGATGVSINPTLSWSAGFGAASHDVYFGTTSPGTFRVNQAGITYTPPGPLANSTTYYWRIDEVGGSGTVQGDVWNFTTVPLSTTPVYPYLTWRNNPTNSVMVNWWNPTATGDSSVDYGDTNSYGSTVTVPTASNFHHVELTGLTSSATYHYRTRSSDGTLSSDNTYTVPVSSPTSFSFAVYGDPRGTQTSNEPYYTRHQVLCNWILAQNFDFALETGDTVWAGGITAQHPLDPQVYWTDFYRLESNLSKSKVIMATMGNHEVQPTGSGETVTYIYYYDLYTGAFPTNGTSGNTGRVYSFDYGNAHFICLSSYQISLTTQATWLEADLIAARANPNIKWIFAFMHAPMYTTNTSHPNRTDCITAWGPLFDTYHVDIVFAGHNHLYERSKSIKAGAAVPDGNGTVYVTTGLGGAEFNAAGTGSPGLFVTTYTNNTLAACVTINGNNLTVNSITNADNVVRDTFTLQK